MEVEWISLQDEKPKKKEKMVLIFKPSLLKDSGYIGHPVTVSNIPYVLKNGVEDGYTHWCRIPPLPKIKK